MAVAVAIPTRTLILGMVADDGTLDAAPLYDLAGPCGMTAEQVRVGLHRLVADGTLRRVGGRGRTSRFMTTSREPEVAILPELAFAELAIAQDAGRRPWDGRWRLVAFSIPEHRRAARDEFRRRLTFLGGGALQPGLYVSPHPWIDLVRAEADRVGAADGLTIAVTDRLVVGGVDAPDELAARIWPLDDIARGYATYRDAVTGRDFDALPPAAAALVMVVALATALEPDPLLPAEMLPADWAGRAARAGAAAEVSRLRRRAQAGGAPLPERLLAPLAALS